VQTAALTYSSILNYMLSILPEKHAEIQVSPSVDRS